MPLAGDRARADPSPHPGGSGGCYTGTVRAPAGLLLALVGGASWVGATPLARADAPVGDGVYGRLDGGLVLSAGVTAGPAFDGGLSGAVGELDLRARYLDAAGVVLAPAYVGDPGAGRLFVGLEVRPFFPARFLLDLWTGHRWLDLVIDSLGVELGAVLGPWGTDLAGAGVAFAWGGGVELPLVLFPGRADGVHLRIGFRRVRPRAGDQSGPRGERISDWTVLTGLVFRGTAGPGIPR